MPSVDTQAVMSDVQAIQAGALNQFANPLSVKYDSRGISIEGQKDVVFDLSQACNSLWIPRYVCVDGAMQIQDKTVMLGIRFNLVSAPQIVCGLGGDCVVSFSGPVKKIFVTKLQGTSGAGLVIMAALGIGVGYSASDVLDGSAPSVPSVDGYRIGNITNPRGGAPGSYFTNTDGIRNRR